MLCSYTAPAATGHTVGSSSQPVRTVFQRLMTQYRLSTTAQASEPKKEDAVSSSLLNCASATVSMQ